jgi:tRNA (mo5U34)-methyltransferase
MDKAEIQRRIATFPRWHYEFDLQGVKTPIFDAAHRNRHQQRVEYFFDTLVEFCGGSLKGKRILDLGCNAGFWSLKAINAGADFVHGVDGRQMHVDEANFVFEASEIDPSRYQFTLGDVLTKDFTELGSFDIVFCLGLLYHIAKPIEMFENVSKVSTDIMVIDTGISSLSGSVVELRKESLDEPRNAIDYEFTMWPTRRAVIDMVGQFGWNAIALKPNMSDYGGMIDYLSGHRVAFIAAKVSDISRLPATKVDPPFTMLEKLSRKSFSSARSLASATALLSRPRARHRGRIVKELLSHLRDPSRGFEPHSDS